MPPRRAAWAMVPAFTLVGLVVALPLGVALLYSLGILQAGTAGAVRVGPGYYAGLLHSPGLLAALYRSLRFMALAVTFEAALAGAIVWLGAGRPLPPVIGLLMYVPLFTAPVASALIWRFSLLHVPGWLNGWLHLSAGHLLVSPLAVPNRALATAAVVDAWQSGPLLGLLVADSLLTIPPVLHAQATVDGATPWQRFVHVTLPGCRQTWLFLLVIRAAETLLVFELIYALAFGGPGTATETASLYIYRLGFLQGDLPAAMAAALSLTALAGLITVPVLLRMVHRERG